MKKKRHWYYNRQGKLFHLTVVCFRKFGRYVLWDSNRISYISDLHLMHRIKNAGCKSKEDVVLQ